MLKDGVVLLVICLIVVGGIAVWWTQTPAPPLSATVQPQVQEPAPVPTPVPRVVKDTPKPRVVEEPLPVAPAPDPEPVAAAAVVQHDPPPFPAVEQIATGVHEAAITSKYGDPALSAVTSRDGHMVETLVYARGHGRSATVIRLEDGKVSTAYSQADPIPPSGFSAPRHLHNE